jgi:glutamyl-tRNA synthetase
MKKTVLKYVLLNVVQYEGEANLKSVIGKLIAENPEFKKDMANTIEETKRVIREVNSWTLEKQKKKLKEMGVGIEKKTKQEEYELPELPQTEKGVITAFPPEPSKYPHIGHAKAALINYLYAKKYGGKFILRFEDTNPELSKLEYYEAMRNGLKWLEIDWDEMDYISNHIPNYYETTEELIQKDKTYVCFCKSEKIKTYRREMKECPCRTKSIEENLENWKKMLSGEIQEGDASVRLKTSMTHKNAAMRDPSIMRIIDKPHPRTADKYHVWPMYDFGTSLMDSWEGVTHRIRSKEFEMRKEIQEFIQKSLGLPVPYIDEIARFTLEGVETSGRKIREKIESGELRGWDDPRLVTLMALKRRGFQPEAIKNFLISTGVSKSESTITWNKFESFNRTVIDPIANRYFAVFNPVKISINESPEIKEAKEPLHPDYPDRGHRTIPVNLDNIQISQDDFEKYQGKEVRLIGLFNVKLDSISKYTGDKIFQDMPKIQWVSEESIPIEIVMNNGSLKEGIAEPDVKNLKIGDIIQFFRFGFCRLDDTEKLRFYFTHK